VMRTGVRITLSPHVRFHGLLGGDGKNAILNSSKGLVLPVLRHEPFGLAVIESLYFGCPLFGTPYGALPELLGRKINPAKPAKKAPDNGQHNMTGSNWGVGFAPTPTPGSGGSVEAFYSDWGCLSVKRSELAEALKHAGQYDRQSCHDYAVAHFSARRMAEQYVTLYEKVLDGYALHETPPAAKDGAEKLIFE
jgi:glycosyltransferase involved in cell wall biosynthesis